VTGDATATGSAAVALLWTEAAWGSDVLAWESETAASQATLSAATGDGDLLIADAVDAVNAVSLPA